MTKYQNDPDFKLRVKKLAALAFLPLADVIDAFELDLADTFEDDELPLLDYVTEYFSMCQYQNETVVWEYTYLSLVPSYPCSLCCFKNLLFP